MGEEREIVGRIPKRDVIDEDTEVVFVRGFAFVNARKHEEVADHHVERAEKAEQALEQLRELGHKLEDHVRVLESLLANGGPGFEPVPATGIQRGNALRDREKWLAALAELEKGESDG